MADLVKILRQSPDVVSCKLDGGNALLDLASSCYYRLNSTAATVWDCIGQGMNRLEILEHLLNEYDVEREQCSTDVDAIIVSFLEAGLIANDD